MTIKIRQETPSDYPIVFKLIEKAFHNLELSDHQEHFLVERLRKSEAFIPKLSLVAEQNNQILGHIILSNIKINNEEESMESLALAPISVLPDFQNQGIGGQLIRTAHRIAKELGFSSIILIGHTDYYPRFGYERLDKYGIQLPFDVPVENAMVIELIEGSLKQVSGVVEYSKAFFG